jgi:hypothetical protein
MPVKLPEGQETIAYKLMMSDSQRQELRKVIATCKKTQVHKHITSYGNVASLVLHAVNALVLAGVGIHEAMKSFETKPKIHSVACNEGDELVGVKHYLPKEDHALLGELSELAEMQRSDFLLFLFFASTRDKKEPTKGNSDPTRHIDVRVDEEEYTVIAAAVDVAFNGSKTVSRGAKQALWDWAVEVIEGTEAK